VGTPRRRLVIILDLDFNELMCQYEMGIECGLKAAGITIDTPPPLEFVTATKMIHMAVQRDCQASANQAIYTEGYGSVFGLEKP
jgi:hypothetical protein